MLEDGILSSAGKYISLLKRDILAFMYKDKLR